MNISADGTLMALDNARHCIKVFSVNVKTGQVSLLTTVADEGYKSFSPVLGVLCVSLFLGARHWSINTGALLDEFTAGYGTFETMAFPYRACSWKQNGSLKWKHLPDRNEQLQILDSSMGYRLPLDLVSLVGQYHIFILSDSPLNQ